MAYAVAVFLLLPTILIVPMSFGPDQYLRFPPNGFTLHWYDAYFKDADWIGATLFSVKIAVLTALAATLIGTLVSVALVRGRLPLKRVFELLVVGPVIVPNIALAIAMFLVFDRLRLTGSRTALLPGRMEAAIEEHEKLLAAIARGDAEGAERLNRERIRHIRDAVEKSISFSII